MSPTALTVVFAAASLATLCMQIGILVLIATVVRRQRPDAYGPLLVWSVVMVAFHVLGALLTPALFFVAGRGGVESMLGAQALNAGLGVGMQMVLVALLARGLVRLSQPPRVEAPEGVPPYR